MSGEAGGNVRPVNSLLEEDVSFDHTTTAGKKLTCTPNNIMKFSGRFRRAQGRGGVQIKDWTFCAWKRGGWSEVGPFLVNIVKEGFVFSPMIIFIRRHDKCF